MEMKLLVACRQEREARELFRVIHAVDGAIRGETCSVETVLSRARDIEPDIILLDYFNGAESIVSELLSPGAARHARILLLCSTYTDRMVREFIDLGVCGCLLTSTARALGAKAVGAIHRGESWFRRDSMLQALRRQGAGSARSAHAPHGDPALTGREREILSLVGDAMSNKEIARKLRISDKTVKNHLHNIYVKLHRSGRYKVVLSKAAAPAAESSRAPSHGNGPDDRRQLQLDAADLEG